MLGEFAELEHALGREAYRRAMAAEDTDEFNSLSRTCKMLGRSMRQSLALRERIQRFRRQEARANPPAPRDEARIARRREALRCAVRRVIFTETETEKRDDLWRHLDYCLDDKDQPDDWAWSRWPTTSWRSAPASACRSRRPSAGPTSPTLRPTSSPPPGPTTTRTTSRTTPRPSTKAPAEARSPQR